MTDVNYMNFVADDAIEDEIGKAASDKHADVPEAGFAAGERELRQASDQLLNATLDLNCAGGAALIDVGKEGIEIGKWHAAYT